MFRDWEDVLMGCIGVFVMLVFSVGGVAAVIEITQSVRAEPAQIACRARQMEPMRRTFRASVTCVPALARRDTLYVEGAR